MFKVVWKEDTIQYESILASQGRRDRSKENESGDSWPSSSSYHDIALA